MLGFPTIGHWEDKGQGRRITSQEIAGCWCSACFLTSQEIRGCWCCYMLADYTPLCLACYRKESVADDDDAMWHRGCLILPILLPFPCYFSDKRIRIPNTNEWGKRGAMHEIEIYSSPSSTYYTKLNMCSRKLCN